MIKTNKFIVLLSLCFTCVEAGPIQPIKPLEVTSEQHAAKIELGRDLFYEKRLSKDQSFSCQTCHQLSQGGDDNVQKSLGGRFSKRNSPTIFNVSGNFRQLWDGRADDLHQQINGLGKKLFNFSKGAELISIEPRYKVLFDKAYDGKIEAMTIKDAIVNYEQFLQTPNSAFDQYLAGNESAISEDAKAGYEAFQQYRCIGCHNGANVGGSIYQIFGIHSDANLLNPDHTDFGRYAVTQKEHHKHMFKVPSLRWVVHTAPYLHDGSVQTLEEMVRIMSKLQVGNEVPINKQKQIIEFLKTLPGELPPGELDYEKKRGNK